MLRKKFAIGSVPRPGRADHAGVPVEGLDEAGKQLVVARLCGLAVVAEAAGHVGDMHSRDRQGLEAEEQQLQVIMHLHAAEAPGGHGHDADRLAEPLAVDVVERVLEHAGHGSVVLGTDDDHRVGSLHRVRKAHQSGRRIVAHVQALLHDREVEVAQIQQGRGGARLREPVDGEARDPDGLAPAADGADQDGDAERIAHAGAPRFSAPRSTLPRCVRGRSVRTWITRGCL